MRNPSLRSIEKEAYIWAEQGIDTLEEASAYIQAANLKNSSLRQLMRTLQIFGRNLTAGEERYATAWLDMGFEMDAIALA
jgi:deferrochelatase/peroxidase EfeB